MSLQVFSFGGGVQSTAALVLAARGELDGITTFLFANVGEKSENPATLRYVREVAMPYAAAHGLQIIERQKTRRDGTPVDLLDAITDPHTRTIGIPVRMANGAPGNRSCTEQWKIRVAARWCWQQGARPKRPALMGIGISLDEYQRMRSDSGISYIRTYYPLIDRRLTRQDCHNLISRAGLPQPPKSSCWYCPFTKLATWRRRLREEPATVHAAADLEALLIRKRARLGKDPVYLTSAGKPLLQVLGTADQLDLFPAEEETYSCGPFVCAIGDGLGGAA